MRFPIAAPLVLIVAAYTVVAFPPNARYSPYTVKENHRVPPGWVKIGPAPPEHLIKLQIALKQSQFPELERHLYEGHTSISLESFGA